jgi:hypothetical protein
VQVVHQRRGGRRYVGLGEDRGANLGPAQLPDALGERQLGQLHVHRPALEQMARLPAGEQPSRTSGDLHEQARTPRVRLLGKAQRVPERLGVAIELEHQEGDRHARVA